MADAEEAGYAVSCSQVDSHVTVISHDTTTEDGNEEKNRTVVHIGGDNLNDLNSQSRSNMADTSGVPEEKSGEEHCQRLVISMSDDDNSSGRGGEEDGGVDNPAFESYEENSDSTERDSPSLVRENKDANDRMVVAVEDTKNNENSSVSNNNSLVTHENGDTEITIPEDALINYNTGRVKAKKKSGGQKIVDTLPEEKIPLEHMEMEKKLDDAEKGVDVQKVPEDGFISEKAGMDGVVAVNGNGAAVPVSSPVTSEKLCQENGTGKQFEEYFIPVNTHKKFLSRGEKLYLTKDNRKSFASWRRVILCGLITLIIAVAVLVGVLAATGILLAESQASQQTFQPHSSSSLPDRASVSRDNVHKPMTPSPASFPSFISSTPSTVLTSKIPRYSTVTQSSKSEGEVMPNVPVIVPANAVSVPNAIRGNLTILDLNFTDALNDKSSPEYLRLASELEQGLNDIFQGKGENFTAVKIISFRNGSVMVEFVAIWNGTERVISASEANGAIQSYLDENNSILAGYLILRNSVKTKEVVDECQRNNGDCSHTCEWDADSLKWDADSLKKVCSCPMGYNLWNEVNCSLEKTDDDKEDVSKQKSTDSGQTSPASSFEDKHFGSDGVMNATHFLSTTETAPFEGITFSVETHFTTTAPQDMTVNSNLNTVGEGMDISENSTRTATTLVSDTHSETEFPLKPFEASSTAEPLWNTETLYNVTDIANVVPTGTKNPSPTNDVMFPFTREGSNEVTGIGNREKSSRKDDFPYDIYTSPVLTTMKWQDMSPVTVSLTTTTSEPPPPTVQEEWDRANASSSERPVGITGGEPVTVAQEGLVPLDIETSSQAETDTLVTTVSQPETLPRSEPPTQDEIHITLPPEGSSTTVADSFGINISSTHAVQSMVTSTTESMTFSSLVTEDKIINDEFPALLNVTMFQSSTEAGTGLDGIAKTTPMSTATVEIAIDGALETTTEKQVEITQLTGMNKTDDAITDHTVYSVTETPTLAIGSGVTTDIFQQMDNSSSFNSSGVEDESATLGTQQPFVPSHAVTSSESARDFHDLRGLTEPDTTESVNATDGEEVQTGDTFAGGIGIFFGENDTSLQNGTVTVLELPISDVTDDLPEIENTTMESVSIPADSDNSTTVISQPSVFMGNETEILNASTIDVSEFTDTTVQSTETGEIDTSISSVDTWLTTVEPWNDTIVENMTFTYSDNYTATINGSTLNETESENATEIAMECDKDMFLCPGENVCRSVSLQCDGIPQCADGSDEMCDGLCGSNFQCNDTKCIAAHAVCDGVWDCEDGSDETGCIRTQCNQHEVMCNDVSGCIKPLDICDGTYNCKDRSDEVDCIERSGCESDGRFYCQGLCIPSSLKCDGSPDCRHGEDEANCTCSEMEFKCYDNNCVPSHTRCNGIKDCTDGSDEMECVQIDKEGVVQVYDSQAESWALFCAEEWTKEGGDELCQELGFSGAESIGNISVIVNGTGFVTKLPSNMSEGYLWTEGLDFNSTCNSSLAATVVCQQFICGNPKQTEKQRSRRDAAENYDPFFPVKWTPQAVVQNTKSRKGCYAAVITPMWLLSSADCIQQGPQNESDWRVMPVHRNRSEDSDLQVQEREVLRITFHPHSSKYRSKIIRDYDMALIRLKIPLVFSEGGVGALCLPEDEVRAGITCFTGVYDFSPPGEKIFTHLALMVQEREECSRPQHYNGAINQRMLCVKGTDARRSLCDEDASAPLMCLSVTSQSQQRWQLAGVLSYQRWCNMYRKQPAVFSNVLTMRSFIERVVGLKRFQVPYDPDIYIQGPLTTTEAFIETTPAATEGLPAALLAENENATEGAPSDDGPSGGLRDLSSNLADELENGTEIMPLPTTTTYLALTEDQGLTEPSVFNLSDSTLSPTLNETGTEFEMAANLSRHQDVEETVVPTEIPDSLSGSGQSDLSNVSSTDDAAIFNGSAAQLSGVDGNLTGDGLQKTQEHLAEALTDDRSSVDSSHLDMPKDYIATNDTSESLNQAEGIPAVPLADNSDVVGLEEKVTAPNLTEDVDFVTSISANDSEPDLENIKATNASASASLLMPDDVSDVAMSNLPVQEELSTDKKDVAVLEVQESLSNSQPNLEMENNTESLAVGTVAPDIPSPAAENVQEFDTISPEKQAAADFRNISDNGVDSKSSRLLSLHESPNDNLQQMIGPKDKDSKKDQAAIEKVFVPDTAEMECKEGFVCGNRSDTPEVRCISAEKVCNGIAACFDGSDEVQCVKINNVTKAVEVFHYTGSWLSICYDGWHRNLSNVVCRQMGYSNEESTGSLDSVGSGPHFFLLDNNTSNQIQEVLQVRNGTCETHQIVTVSCASFGDKPECGHWNFGGDSFKSNGTNLEDNMTRWSTWPSLGFLQEQLGNLSQCVANFISPTWVVTSLRCLQSKDPTLQAVNWVFSVDTSLPDSERAVSRIVPHPGTSLMGELLPVGVALVELQRSVQFGLHANALCLPENKAQPQQQCVTVGLDTGDSTDGTPTNLQPMTVIPREGCNSTTNYTGDLLPRICAVGVDGSPCQVDTDAPLMCQDGRGRWEIQGILVEGGCNEPDRPPVYVSILPVSRWIESVTEQSTDRLARH